MIHRVSVYLHYTSLHLSFPPFDRQHFAGNLPWQVENISIKHWLLWQRRLVLDSLSDLSRHILHILSLVCSIVDILQTLFFVFVFFFCLLFLIFLPCGYFLSSQRFIFSHHVCCKWVNYWLVHFLVSTDEQCPSLQVEDWRFTQTARHNITGKWPSQIAIASLPALFLNVLFALGFNLVRRFSLLKSVDVKKIRNPRGPVILRLGKTALLRPTEYVAPTCCTAVTGRKSITGSSSFWNFIHHWSALYIHIQQTVVNRRPRSGQIPPHSPWGWYRGVKTGCCRGSFSLQM